jgi:hypothetical protein
MDCRTSVMKDTVSLHCTELGETCLFCCVNDDTHSMVSHIGVLVCHCSRIAQHRPQSHFLQPVFFLLPFSFGTQLFQFLQLVNASNILLQVGSFGCLNCCINPSAHHTLQYSLSDRTKSLASCSLTFRWLILLPQDLQTVC